MDFLDQVHIVLNNIDTRLIFEASKGPPQYQDTILQVL